MMHGYHSTTTKWSMRCGCCMKPEELTDELCSSLDNGFRKLQQAVDENTKVLMGTQRLMKTLFEELSAIKRVVPIDKDD
ncbi:hypothetical protein DPMN_010959 [Dreissena polymorpha]|uniref:Uncharacterized protein n=1 Tax=Dreissena polymorpha TaxID=45954 RepID=A0A9D4N367_DREPO|nr:hypothetical protein DPMN_010959 [Dreissena polymorpha]